MAGRFLDKLYREDNDTVDVDIILTGDSSLKEIENLIAEATKIGIEKYSTFFDVIWHSSVPDMDSEPRLYTVYLHSNQWIEDGKVVKNYPDAVQLRKNLWKLDCFFPTQKQIERMQNGYKHRKALKIEKQMFK